MSKPDEWMDLQVKIFLRWVNQRLALRSMKVENLKGFAPGEPLVALMEILSEKPCPFKMKTGNLQRMQMLDNCSNALKFITTTCGIKNTCSAENLVDGEPKSVLGLLWAIMSTYLKFQDDDDGPALSVKDSLMMWFKNQMTDPALAESIKDVTKSFHNGLVVAATVEKFRPQLIDVGSMDAKEGPANLKKAFDAATAFFGLEQYLTPAEMVKLDEKCMIVFLSEFFYGIAAQRKVRISCHSCPSFFFFLGFANVGGTCWDVGRRPSMHNQSQRSYIRFYEPLWQAASLQRAQLQLPADDLPSRTRGLQRLFELLVPIR